MNPRRKMICAFSAVFALFFSERSLAQVAFEDRSHLWPESASEVYSGIISATSGVLFFLLIIFGVFFFLIWRNTKSKKAKLILVPYSALFAGWVAYLYADTFANVDEFLQLCENKAGFHGQPIPLDSGVVVSENLNVGCKGDCITVLSYDSNVSFVEGTATKINFLPWHKGIRYKPGRYRVSKKDGNSPFCKGLSPFQINDVLIPVYPLPEPHCFHFEQIESLTAEFSIRPVYLRDFVKAKNIFGQYTKIVNRWTGEVRATIGRFEFTPGRIDRLNFARIGMDPVTIANCWDISGAHKKMWGIRD